MKNREEQHWQAKTINNFLKLQYGWDWKEGKRDSAMFQCTLGRDVGPSFPVLLLVWDNGP